MRHEPADDGVLFAAVFHIQEAEHGEHDRADEVDDEIFHRVDQADIEIAAEVQILAVDCNLCDVADMNRVIGVRGVEHHRADGMHNGVFLHVKPE